MKFCFNPYGLMAHYGDPAALTRAATGAEAAGFDSFCVTDHVVMGQRTDRYPFGAWPTPLDFPWLEPLTTLGVVAGATSRIGLTQGILIAPLRPAAFLAKQAATLDQLSRGRLSLGLGYGWQREEFLACGVEYSKRRAIFVEQLRVMRGLWREAPFSFEGEYHTLDRVHCRPGPWQREHVPLLLGVAPTQENRPWICELGDGWLPISDDPAEYLPEIARLRADLEQHQRDPEQFEFRARLRTVHGADGRPDLAATLSESAPLFAAGLAQAEFYAIEFVHSDSLDELDALLLECAPLLAALRR